MPMADDAALGSMRIRDLSVLAYAQGFSLWHYAGQGLPLARMMVPGFFDPATGHLERGDIVLITASDGGTAVAVGPASNGANFTVSPLQLAAPAPQEIACPITTPPPPAPLPLLRRLWAQAVTRCWSR